MSRTMTMCAAAVASGLATFSLVSGFSTTEAIGNGAAPAETAAHAQNRGENQRETFEGRVVDLYTYMTRQEDLSENGNRDRDDNDRNRERDGDSQRDRPGVRDQTQRPMHNPIGVIVKDSGLLGESETLHVLLFEPTTSSANQPSASQCREMIGKSVQLVGRKVERDDITAIVVEQIRGAESRPGTPNRERPSYDRNEPSRDR